MGRATPRFGGGGRTTTAGRSLPYPTAEVHRGCIAHVRRDGGPGGYDGNFPRDRDGNRRGMELMDRHLGLEWCPGATLVTPMGPAREVALLRTRLQLRGRTPGTETRTSRTRRTADRGS